MSTCAGLASRCGSVRAHHKGIHDHTRNWHTQNGATTELGRRWRHFGARTRAALISTFIVGMVVGLAGTLAPVSALPAAAAVPVVGASAVSGSDNQSTAPDVAIASVRGVLASATLQAANLVAELDTYGVPGAIAQRFDAEFNRANPTRLPFTGGEQTAASWIADALRYVGFADDAVTVQPFSIDLVDPLQLATLEIIGATHAPDALETSQNVFVRIAGTDAEAGIIVLGAGYDTFTPAGVALEPSKGANVSLLLETAQRLQNAELAHTVYVAFFGGDVAGRVGARHFFNSLPAAQQANIDLVVNVDAIGAANTLFFTAEVCAGDEICPEQSAAFASVVSSIAANVDAGADLVLFKEENFDFGDFGECPCCVFNTPDAVIGVPVVTLFAFDFEGYAATAPSSSATIQHAQTGAALAGYSAFLQTLLRADRTFN